MRPIHASLAALLLAAASLAAPSRAAPLPAAPLPAAPLSAAPGARLPETRPVDRFLAVAVSPDGRHVATVERRGDVPPVLVIRDRAGHATAVRIGCPDGESCVPASPVWTGPDRLAFLAIDDAGVGASAVEQDGPAGGQAGVLARFDGPLAELRVGPGGALAVLATANAHKRPGATAAAANPAGVVGGAVDEQRIARVDASGLRFVSPTGLYVYHYDWLPDGRGFVAVAAPGDGDSQWWVASLHRFAGDGTGGDTVLFRPPGREQLADPVVAADGRSVAFIGGWMSDEGSTGGDVYRLALDRPGAVPSDLMAGSGATATSIARGCGGTGVVAAVLEGRRLRIVRFDGAGGAATLWSGVSRLRAGGWNDGIACGGGTSAAASEDFTTPPELVAGPLGRWTAISRENRGVSLDARARSLDWTVDGIAVQGWLLTPGGDAAGAAGRTRPLVVDVHGGPQAAAEPEWAGDTLAGALLRRGFSVVMPNYRGSFGGGERFAQGSIGDIGGGDWRDVLGSVDAAEHAAGAIDDRRVGIVGGSYGGYMAMWAVSQTHRFAAAVAEAGVSDWLSIEGEAPQAGSDPISFGANVYDDPRPYLRASPVMHIKGATTPTLITVGDRDAECPEPQSEEFATALAALGVPHAFVVYPGEGHGFSDPRDRADERRRAVGWFVRWLGGRRTG